MRDLLESPRSVVATVALSGGGFISEVKTRKDAELIVVTPGNRDALPDLLARRLTHE
jgi:nucleoside-triphosphatase THEP1